MNTKIGDTVVFLQPTMAEVEHAKLLDELSDHHEYEVEGITHICDRVSSRAFLRLAGMDGLFPAEWFNRKDSTPEQLWNRLAAKLDQLVPQALQAGADAVQEIEQALNRALNKPRTIDMEAYFEWVEEAIAREDRALLYVKSHGFILMRAGHSQLGPAASLRELIDLDFKEE